MKIFRQLRLNFKALQITLPAFALSCGVSYAAGSKKLISLDNTDFVVLISFLIFVGVLAYFKVPSIVGAFLDKRSSDIQSEIEKAGEILEEAKKIKLSAEADIEQSANKAKDGLRDEVAALVIAGAQKILDKEINAKANKDIIDSLIKKI